MVDSSIPDDTENGSILVPSGYIKETYGFDNYTDDVSLKSINKNVKNNPKDIIEGIIYVLDEACDALGVEKKYAVSRDLNLTITPSKESYSFKGKDYKTIKNELTELTKNIRWCDRNLNIDWGNDRLGHFLDVFEEVDDIEGAYKNNLLKGRKGKSIDDWIFELEQDCDFDAGGLIYSGINLDIKKDGRNNVKISAKISRTMMYNKASDEEMRRRREEMVQYSMESSVKIEFGSIPGFNVKRVSIDGEVVEVVAYDHIGVYHFTGQDEDIQPASLELSICKAAYEGHTIEEIILMHDKIKISPNSWAEEWSDAIVFNKKTLDKMFIKNLKKGYVTIEDED